MPVESITGRFTFWIGRSPVERVPVVLTAERLGWQPHGATDVRGGDRVAVFGTIHAVHDVRRLDDEDFMEPGEWRGLGAERVYISAMRVEVLTPDPQRGHRERPAVTEP